MPIKPLRKAVLPVAGLGTRFLPATKAMPKEMLTVVDRPLIQYAVDEARAAGIDLFCMVTGRGKTALIDHFDVSYELEATLKARNKTEALAGLEAMRLSPGAITTVRQQEPLGLGHAIWCARTFIGDDPFVILLPDDLVLAETSCTEQLARAYRETEGSVVAVIEVPPDQTNKYGILDIGSDDGRLVEVKGLVEKPKPENAPSNLAITGRYVLPPEIFDCLARTKPGAGGEIQLTDAMRILAQERGLWAYIYEGISYDAGDKLGFLKATVELALMNEELGKDFREYLKTLKL